MTVQAKTESILAAALDAIGLGISEDEVLPAIAPDSPEERILSVFEANGYEDVADFWQGNFVEDGIIIDDGDDLPSLPKDEFAPGDDIVIRTIPSEKEGSETFDVEVQRITYRNSFDEIVGITVEDLQGNEYHATLVSPKAGIGGVYKVKYLTDTSSDSVYLATEDEDAHEVSADEEAELVSAIMDEFDSPAAMLEGPAVDDVVESQRYNEWRNPEADVYDDIISNVINDIFGRK